MSHYMPFAVCPRCTTKLTGATNVAGEDRPKEGDATVCRQCGVVLAFQADGTLRRITQKDQDRWESNAEGWQSLLAAVRAVNQLIAVRN